MANHILDKFLTSTQDAYRNPYHQSDFKYYQPPMLIPRTNDYHPNQGTEKWFQDYRRSKRAEQILSNNLLIMRSPVRPTLLSDQPDIALGARKAQREALFPIIHNNPVYTLTNRHYDRETYRDQSYMNDTRTHRDQYRDLTGSKHKKVDQFYYPFPAKETFDCRNVDPHTITDFPGHHTAANEFVYLKKREDCPSYLKSEIK